MTTILNVTDSSMKPLKRITVEFYTDENKEKMVTIEKTDEEGNISFDNDEIRYFVIDPVKYAINKNYKKIENYITPNHHIHIPLTGINENRYIICPVYKGKSISNIVCRWYNKNDEVLGTATSNETSDCNLFLPKTVKPAYFKLTTKKGEKKLYKDVDSRQYSMVMAEPEIPLDVELRPV